MLPKNNRFLYRNNNHTAGTNLWLLLALALLLTAPVAVSLIRSAHWAQLAALLIASAALASVLVCTGKLCSRRVPRLGATLVTLAVLLVLLTRTLYAGLLDFTGMGFTNEVFIHTEWNAVLIGLKQYAWPLALAAAFIATLLWWLWRHPALRTHQWHTERQPKSWYRQHGFISATLLITAFAILARFSPNLPTAQLFDAYRTFATGNTSITLFQGATTREEAARRATKWLEPIRGRQPLPTPKSQLRASASPDSPNLILVYLESFSDMFVSNPDYPGLTPNLDALKKRFMHFSNNYSSGYVTIEGIANSQCGTLMNMQFANNSLTTPSGRLPEMACLGDILKKAGYHQTYLGGARSDFAGKGDFFTDHGYDVVLGWSHWAKQGFDNEGLWGLPDTQLFQQALKTIEKYRQADVRHNVTLLTLATHLPGFRYAGCPTYAPHPEEHLLNGIHCTDYLLGQFVEQLEERGILEDTVLLIQGDHAIFNAPEPKRLFGPKKVTDRRLFTLVSTPEMRQTPPNNLVDDTPLSSYDMVANLLDWLKVNHNTPFVLAQKLASSRMHDRYLLSRYSDYFKGQMVGNHKTRGCSPDTTATQPELPLSACDKRTTLQAVYAINDLYAKPAHSRQEVCQHGLIIAKNRRGRLIQVKWVGKDISRTFSEKGFPVSTAKPGVIAMLLNAEGKLVAKLFFDLDDEEDTRSLSRYLQNIPTDWTIVMARNIATGDVSPTVYALWPEPVKKHTFFMATAKSQESKQAADTADTALRIIAATDENQFGYRIYPPVCGKSVETNISMDEPPAPEFCPITRWGPKKLKTGQPFNTQPDGSSAFWVVTACAPPDAQVYLDGKPLKTLGQPPQLAALLPAGEEISQPGRYVLELRDPVSGARQIIGQVKVR